jgi:multimeric flavodoxin WrbA
MKHLLVVYHSMTGATEQLARAALAGAAHEGEIEVRLRHASEATSADVLAADGYVFATPENLASMAGLMKDFFDRIYYDALDRVNGRPYAALIAAGTDGAGAARQLQRIATGLRLREVAPATIVRNGAQTPEAILAPKTVPDADLATARELGAAFAAGLAAGIF